MDNAPSTSDAAVVADSAILAADAAVHPALALATHFHLVGLLSVLAWLTALFLAGKHFGWGTAAKLGSVAIMIWLGGILVWSCWNASGIRTAEVNTGIQTLAAWAAVALVLLASRKDPRMKSYRLLLGFSIAGIILASLTARQIDGLEIDLSEELEARQEMVETETAEAPSGLDDVAIPMPDEKSIYEKAAEEEVPLYKQAGKKTRAEGMQQETELTAAAKTVEGETMADRVTVPEDEKYLAVAAANWNIVGARLTFLTVVLVLIVDYLRRFNNTFSFLYPVPIAGRLPDHFGSKSHTVALATKEQELVTGLLAAVVRKGETFLYFGPALKLGDTLSRLRFAACGIDFPVHHYDDEKAPSSSEFVFESAWFGRYASCVSGDTLTAQLLDDLIAFLESRSPSQARTRRVLNIVVAAEIAITDAQRNTLAKHCEEMNLRLIHLVDNPATNYDEIVTAVPASERGLILQFAP
jgi:hypothetical protein